MDLEQHAVTTRGLSEPVDLFAQGDELLTRLFQGFEELGVAGGEVVDAILEILRIRRPGERRALPFRTRRGQGRGVGRGERLPRIDAARTRGVDVARMRGLARVIAARVLHRGFMAIRFGHY